MDKKIVGGNNIVEIFLQTEFQKHWAKDKEMTGIFHYFSFFLRKHGTRPLCIRALQERLGNVKGKHARCS